MLPGLKITLVAMAVTVLAIVVVLAGLGSDHGETGPRLSGTAIQRPGAPLTLVDNPQAESLLRQRVARRSDEVARLLAMPNGPLFAQGNETANDAEPADASASEPPKTTSAAAPRHEERHAATSKAEATSDERTTATVNEGPLTPIEADDYRRALRRATNVQVAAIVNPPADNPQAASTAQSAPAGAERTALWVPEPRPKPAITEALPPVRDIEAEKKAAAKRAAARARRIAERARQVAPPAPSSWTGPFISNPAR